MGCKDKELLTSLLDLALCGISMLKTCELKQGQMQMGGVTEISRMESPICKRKLKEHGLLTAK